MAYVEVDGVRVHYVEHGAAGPGVATAVLVHGFPVDQRLMVGAFEPVFADRPGWRRVYVDLPGMGGTVAPDVASTDDVFRILRGAVQALVPEGPYVLVGQSYGGYLARGLTAADAGRVAGLAVVVTVVEPRHDLRELPPCQVLVQDPALIERVGSEASLPSRLSRCRPRRPGHDPGRRWIPAWPRPDREAVARVEAHYAGSFPVEPAPFEKPALVLVGRQDSITGYRDAWGLADYYPRASFAVLDRAGHSLHLEQRGLFEALVGEWLDRVEEAGPV